jgi:hypothetical protein
VVTISSVAHRSTFVHLRAELAERKRWQEAASSSGRSLSALIRDALEAELGHRDHGDGDGGVAQAPPAHEAASKSESLADIVARIGELVDRP